MLSFYWEQDIELIVMLSMYGEQDIDYSRYRLGTGQQDIELIIMSSMYGEQDIELISDVYVRAASMLVRAVYVQDIELITMLSM